MPKLVRVADSVPVRLFIDAPKKMGPIPPTWLSETQIWLILADMKPPVHIYAVNPNNEKEQVILTKRNYQMTNEELFGTTRVVNEPTPVEEPVVPVVEEVIPEEPVIEEPVFVEDVEEIPVGDVVEEPVVEDTLVEDVADTLVEESVVEEPVVENSKGEPIVPVVEETIEDDSEIVEDLSDLDEVVEDGDNTQYSSKKKKKHR